MLPIVCDASSCTEDLVHAVEADEPGPGQRPLRVTDVVEFTADHILPSLPTVAKLSSVVLHLACSSTRMGLNAALTAVANRVEVPENWGCCGFAGDRGMLHPELTASATDRQAREVNAMGVSAPSSCNRTCELGMTRATGHDYRNMPRLPACAGTAGRGNHRAGAGAVTSLAQFVPSSFRGTVDGREHDFDWLLR